MLPNDSFRVVCIMFCKSSQHRIHRIDTDNYVITGMNGQITVIDGALT